MDFKEFLKEFISFRSISSEKECENVMTSTAKFLQNALERMGLVAELCVPHCGGNPIVFALRCVSDAKFSLLLYGHYDVQPVDPLESWDTSPFCMKCNNGLLFGRGIADDKGPLAAMLFAMEDILGEMHNFPINIFVTIEGEEEIGSRNFAEFLRENRQRIAVDGVLVCDTGSLSSELPTLTTALRSIIEMEISLQTASEDLHSGFGGCLPNAVHELVRLCSLLHRADGSVNVDGFYGDIVAATADEMETFYHLEREEFPFLETFAVHGVQNPFPELPIRGIHALKPSLEINGIFGGHCGNGCKTIIPCRATAKITVRVVNGQNPQKLLNLLEKFFHREVPSHVQLHLQARICGAPYAIDHCQSSVEFKAMFQQMEDSLQQSFGNKPLHLREGGSIGVVRMFRDHLQADSLLVGIVPPDAHIHAPNEHISLEVLQKARGAFAHFFKELAKK
ncbi:MAG: M20/M25/M40 family metallo-hydrolase [Puniceicoccales bacterium]|jgi:acetylornithine deacetylase/succinyl-diaminopimelate desuccinylase-like protein|nr:M20/M25/M40 family metallo-hydrolase [Puniceicoccales bacterium]